MEYAGSGCQGHGAGRQGDGRYDAADVGLEKVGAHAGDVTHVITHVVGDHAGVAGVVFGYARFHLADQVGSNVSGFGEDSAAHAGEQSDGAGPETETGHRADVLKYEEQDGDAQQADAHHGYTHYCPAGEGDAQSGIETDHGGRSGANVGPHRYVHPDETRQSRAYCAHQV